MGCVSEKNDTGSLEPTSQPQPAFTMSAQQSSSSNKNQNLAKRPSSDPLAAKPAKKNRAQLQDPHPERMENPTVDNLDDTMISGKMDAGISTEGGGRMPGSEH